MVHRDTGGIEPWPVEDPSGVDARRAAVGLGPLAAYVDAMRDKYSAFVRR